MAKKKRGKDGDQPPSEDLPETPDPRLAEVQLPDSLPGEAQVPETPLEQAQQLIYQALGETDNRRRRSKLAHKALEICPDCVDAYVLLAEMSPGRKKALELYAKGVEAGERLLGPQLFQQAAGHFWELLITRPYMRARLGLAQLLWTMGSREEAIQHLQDMLRLNPNDNQGVRYVLASFLLRLDRNEELGRLLEQYADETSTAWQYTRALLAFRQRGDTAETRRLFKKALQSNKYVPAYLLGERWPPAEPPSFFRPGDETEAIHYSDSFLVSWKATPGALAWLREQVHKPRRKKTVPAGKGPLPFIKKWLREQLPQRAETWQADFRQMSAWVQIASEKVRPWMALVTCPDTDLVLAHDIAEDEPTAEHLWDKVVQAMQKPLKGRPHRPCTLQVRADARWQALRPHLEAIGIQLQEVEELPQIDEVFQEISEHVLGHQQPGLLDMPGIKPEQVGSFFEAAAFFFQQAPWRKVGYEAAIRVECGKYQSGPWYAVLMGQSGLTMGLALYEDLKLLQKLWHHQMSDEDNARLSVATTVTYGEEADLSMADLEAARRYGWKVARPDAYPIIFHKERGMTMRPPLAWELELMEACLRAVPGFVQRHKQSDGTRAEVIVPVASGELRLGLAWVQDI